MNGGATNLDISNMTIGVSKEGIIQFLDETQVPFLREINYEINNVDEVVQAINNCWQGESRDRFLESFAKMKEQLQYEITKEYNEFHRKMFGLANKMAEIDKNGIYDY